MRLRLLVASLAFSLGTSALAAPPSIQSARKLASAGQYESAIELLRKLINNSKQSPDAKAEALQEVISYQFMALQSFSLDKISRAVYLKSIMADYKALLLLKPDESQLYSEYGSFLLLIKDTSLAIDAFTTSLYLGSQQAAIPLGKLYLDREEYERAVEVLKLSTANNPAASTLWFRLGFAQWRLNDHEAAVASLGKAYQLDTLNNYLLSQELIERLSLPQVYSRALLKAERYQDAVNIAKKYLLFHNDTGGYLFAASVCADANQPENAIYYYVRALEDATQRADLDPRPQQLDILATVLNSYAWFFCTIKDERYQTPELLLKAFEMSTRAVKLSNRKDAHLDTLAELYYQLGYPEEALVLEQEALQKKPSYEFYSEQVLKFQAALDERPSVLVAPQILQLAADTLRAEESSPSGRPNPKPITSPQITIP